MRFLLLILFFILISFKGYAVQNDPKIRLDVKCYQTMGKNYYSDGEVDNVKLNTNPIEVKTLNAQTMILDINSETYNYNSGIVYSGNDGVQRFNMLFSPSSPGLMKTKTASILIFNGRPFMVHLILTEPLMGNKRSFVRTSFYNCVK
jgi:hypothetical protein